MSLLLYEQGLTEVPADTWRHNDVRVLDLGHNKIALIPDAIGDLVQLDFLYLHDNELTTVPDTLRNLHKLRYLNISENHLTTFPIVESLIELRATDNEIAALPEGTGALAKLRELHLRNNKLATLPASIGELQSLRQLDLRGNPLTQLPESLLELPRLEKVDVRWVTIDDRVLDRLEARGCLVYR